MRLNKPPEIHIANTVRMNNRDYFDHWITRLAGLAVVLALAGCADLVPSASGTHDGSGQVMSPASPKTVLTQYYRLIDALKESGDESAALIKLQEARPYAEAEWNAPLAPTDLRPRYLNMVDVDIAKLALPANKDVAYAALDALWGRHSHPYTVDASSFLLLQAGDLLAQSGDRDYARRMYLAAADTPQLEWEIKSPQKLSDDQKIAYKLRSLGFEKDAQDVEKRLAEIREMMGKTQYRELAGVVEAANDFVDKQEAEAALNALAAEGYAYFGRHTTANSLRRRVTWQLAYIEKSRQQAQETQARNLAEEERIRKYQQARQESRNSDGLTSFLDALGGGIQAYVGARSQGASATARNAAALQAAAGAPTGSSATGPAPAGASARGRAAGSGAQSARQAAHCVTRDRQAGGSADYLGNTCDFPIEVKWFALNDPSTRHCAIGTGGCSAGLKARQARSSVYKLKGQIVHAACEYPARPQNPGGGSWTGGPNYVCGK